MVRRRGQRAQAGYTLLELGISIGCIAILVTAVVATRGFIENAKMRSTIQTVVTIQHGAFAWIDRGVNAGDNFWGLTLGAMCDLAGGGANRVIPVLDAADADCGYRTAWGTPFIITPLGRAFTVDFCLPTPELAIDTKRMMDQMGFVSVGMGGICACAGCDVRLLAK